MRLLEKLKAKSTCLKHEITALYYACQHPNVGRLPKILIVFTVRYALSPIDLIPDCIPVLGYVDDLLILPALITLSIKSIPQDLLKEARNKAEQEPVQLKKNWLFAVLFIAIWVLLLTAIISAII